MPKLVFCIISLKIIYHLELQPYFPWVNAVLKVTWASCQIWKNCGLRMRRECRERFPPPPRVGDPDMHHGTCVTHVLWCMPGSLTSGFLWYRWRGKRSRHSRRMRNLQCYVSGKLPMQWISQKNKMLHNRRYLLQTTKLLFMTTGDFKSS